MKQALYAHMNNKRKKKLKISTKKIKRQSSYKTDKGFEQHFFKKKKKANDHEVHEKKKEALLW
jgi:hypothetical protein